MDRALDLRSRSAVSGGVDASGFLRWHGLVVDALSAGELVRLAALLKVFEGRLIEAATMHSDALWAVVGRDGHASGMGWRDMQAIRRAREAERKARREQKRGGRTA